MNNVVKGAKLLILNKPTELTKSIYRDGIEANNAIVDLNKMPYLPGRLGMPIYPGVTVQTVMSHVPEHEATHRITNFVIGEQEDGNVWITGDVEFLDEALYNEYNAGRLTLGVRCSVLQHSADPKQGEKTIHQIFSFDLVLGEDIRLNDVLVQKLDVVDTLKDGTDVFIVNNGDKLTEVLNSFNHKSNGWYGEVELDGVRRVFTYDYLEVLKSDTGSNIVANFICDSVLRDALLSGQVVPSLVYFFEDAGYTDDGERKHLIDEVRVLNLIVKKETAH